MTGPVNYTSNKLPVNYTSNKLSVESSDSDLQSQTSAYFVNLNYLFLFDLFQTIKSYHNAVYPNEDRQHHPIQRQAPSLEEEQAQALNLLRPTTFIASTQKRMSSQVFVSIDCVLYLCIDLKMSSNFLYLVWLQSTCYRIVLNKRSSTSNWVSFYTITDTGWSTVSFKYSIP